MNASPPTPQLIQNGPEFYEAGLAFRYLMPDGPGPYATAVLLHGRLGDEDVMWVFRQVVPRPWLVVAPRAIVPEAPRGFSWHAQPRGNGRRWPPSTRPSTPWSAFWPPCPASTTPTPTA